MVDVLNCVRDEDFQILEQISRAQFSDAVSFRNGVSRIVTTFSSERQPTEGQTYLINKLSSGMEFTDMNRTVVFILYLDEDKVEIIRNLTMRSREIDIGKLLKILANCDNVMGIETIIDLLCQYTSEVSARIVNYLFKLRKNGYRETVELLSYHRDHRREDIFLFFEHYYNNQWLDHEHKPDEVVNEVIREGDRIVGVMGKEYRRSGHLKYSGMYRNKLYNGRGTYFTETQDCYEGMFDGGNRRGEFKIFNERSLLRVEQYDSDGKLGGQVVEYYSNGEIRSKTQYRGGKKNGECQIRDGTGALIFKGNYLDDIRCGEGYEFLAANLAWKGFYNNGAFQKRELVYVPTIIYSSEPTKHNFNENYYSLRDAVPLIGQWINAFLASRGTEINIDREFFAGFYIDNEILDRIERFTSQHNGRILDTNMESVKYLTLFGPGLGRNADAINMARISSLVHKINMIQKLCLCNMKIIDFGSPQYDLNFIVSVDVSNCSLENGVFSQSLSKGRVSRLHLDHCFGIEDFKFGRKCTAAVVDFAFDSCFDVSRFATENSSFSVTISELKLYSLGNLEEITIGNECFKLSSKCTLQCLPKLRKVTFGRKAFANASSLVIDTCSQLTDVTFEFGSFEKTFFLVVQNNQSLQSVSLNAGCFMTVKDINIADCPQLQTWAHKTHPRGDFKVATSNIKEEGLRAMKQWLKK